MQKKVRRIAARGVRDLAEARVDVLLIRMPGVAEVVRETFALGAPKPPPFGHDSSIVRDRDDRFSGLARPVPASSAR